VYCWLKHVVHKYIEELCNAYTVRSVQMDRNSTVCLEPFCGSPVKIKKKNTHTSRRKIMISTVGLGIYRTMVITCCGCVSPSSVQSYELWHWPFIIHGLYIDLLHYFDFKVDSLWAISSTSTRFLECFLTKKNGSIGSFHTGENNWFLDNLLGYKEWAPHPGTAFKNSVHTVRASCSR